ncbi:MAG: DUF1206 domain-containing protein [Wenzhouxiangella sp.]
MSWLAASGRFSVATLARIGYAAKGLVFAAVGFLALLAVFGLGEGRVTGTDGAIHIIGATLPGRLGFGLLATGLAAHVFWRLYQALIDPDERGAGWRGLIQRSGFLISAGLYATLVLITLSAVTDLGGGASGAGDAAAHVIEWPGGRWLLGLVGSGLIGTAGYQLWRAWAQPFRDKWFRSNGVKHLHGGMALLSSYGIAARAVMFAILGWSLVRGGWFASSDEVTDVASTMWRISTENYGHWLLGVMAAGFLCYGIYCGLNAAFRKICVVAPGDRSSQKPKDRLET